MMASAAAGRTIVRAASGAAIAGLVGYWFLQPAAFPLKALGLVLTAGAIASPAAGLLAFAGLAPLSTSIADLCGATGMGARLLELMALGIGAGTILHGQPPGGRTRIGPPALFMAAVAVASAAAMVPAAAAPFARNLADGSLVQALALRQTAESSPVWSPMFTAMVIAECALLAWAAERTVRRSPALALQLVAMGLAGHAASAAMSLQAVIGGALRTGDALDSLPQLLLGVRVNTQMDLNAAASALLLAGIAGSALIAAGVRKVIVIPLLLLVAAGLWMTGSRVALAMGAVAGVAAIAWPAVKSGRRRAVAIGAAVLILGASAWLLISSTSNRSTPLPRSIEIRRVMAVAGFEMFKQAPMFGIGVTRFYEASTPYAGPYLLSVGWRPYENAHNNFVQALAEQGLVGLGALLWILATVLSTPMAPALAQGGLRDGLMLAVTACLGTWLTGHPLLVPEFAFVFWFYCGILTAMTPPVSQTHRRWLPAMLVIAVAASVPLRAAALRSTLELEHYGIGLSPWQHDDSQRYREAGQSFTLYLPAGQLTQVPVRRAPSAPDRLAIEVRVRGRLIDRVPVEGNAWQDVRVAVPEGRERFEPVDFDVQPQGTPTAGTAVLLRVGKAVTR